MCSKNRATERLVARYPPRTIPSSFHHPTSHPIPPFHHCSNQLIFFNLSQIFLAFFKNFLYLCIVFKMA